MKNNKKSQGSFHIGTGITSIIMVFVVLCLTVFGVLSFAIASSDYKLSKKSSDNIKAYYDAIRAENSILAQINEVLYNVKDTEESSTYMERATKEIENLGYLIENDVITVTYDISEKQKLISKVKINDLDADYTIQVIQSYVETVGGNHSPGGVELITNFN